MGLPLKRADEIDFAKTASLYRYQKACLSFFGKEKLLAMSFLSSLDKDNNNNLYHEKQLQHTHTVSWIKKKSINLFFVFFEVFSCFLGTIVPVVLFFSETDLFSVLINDGNK